MQELVIKYHGTDSDYKRDNRQCAQRINNSFGQRRVEHKHDDSDDVLHSGERIKERVACECVLGLFGQDVREDEDGAENHREAETVQCGV